jgi:hypothetical protein
MISLVMTHRFNIQSNHMNISNRCTLRSYSVEQVSGVASDLNTSDYDPLGVPCPRIIGDMNVDPCQSREKPLFPVSLIQDMFLADKSRVE